MNDTTTIVAAVDRFPEDDAVLARAVELATTTCSKLIVAHFVGQISGWNLATSELNNIEQQALSVANERLKAALAKYADIGLEIHIRTDSGSPAMRLIELSEEIDVDLFVMGANQSGSIMDKVLGSTTDRVIRGTGTPVLVIKKPVQGVYEHVLIAVDTSDEPGAVATVAPVWFPQADFELLHIVQVPVQFEEAMLRAGISQAKIIAYRDALEHKAHALLRSISEQLKNRAARFTTRVLTGDPITALVRVSCNSNTELIVLEPGSSSRVRQALLGSVTRRVLRASMCDVLIYRSAENGLGEKLRSRCQNDGGEREIQ